MMNIKKVFALVTALFVATGIFAESKKFVVDDGNILSKKEENKLHYKLEEISYDQWCDVVIVSVPSLNGRSMEDVAIDYYVSCDFGYGDDKSCILILVNVEEKNFDLIAFEFGEYALTEERMQKLKENFASNIEQENWYKAFNSYANDCNKILTAANKDSGFDPGYENRKMIKKSLPVIKRVIDVYRSRG